MLSPLYHNVFSSSLVCVCVVERDSVFKQEREEEISCVGRLCIHISLKHVFISAVLTNWPKELCTLSPTGQTPTA